MTVGDLYLLMNDKAEVDITGSHLRFIGEFKKDTIPKQLFKMKIKDITFNHCSYRFDVVLER